MNVLTDPVPELYSHVLGSPVSSAAAEISCVPGFSDFAAADEVAASSLGAAGALDTVGLSAVAGGAVVSVGAWLAFASSFSEDEGFFTGAGVAAATVG